jgi:hypothetical protein
MATSEAPGMAVKKRLYPALKVEVVIDLLDSGIVREAVVELERAEARLHGVGRGDGLGNVRRHLRRVSGAGGRYRQRANQPGSDEFWQV